MSKTFAVMKTNVGNLIQDTSTGMATLIGVWLNDAYLDIARSCNWSVFIDDNYTFESAVGTATYTLPEDFEEEILLADIQDGRCLDRYTEGKWWQERATAHQADAISNGTPLRYVILREVGKFKLDPPPDAIHTYAFPYKKTLTALSADASTVSIQDIEPVMELKAVGEAWAYKRQFQKADYYLGRYELEKLKRIGQERSAINQRYQMIPEHVSGYPQPLTGWGSYDTI